MTFVETLSPFVFYDLPWQPAEKEIKDMFETQWTHLRSAVLFCLRSHPGQHTPDRLNETRQHFDLYGFAAQAVRLLHHNLAGL